MAWLWTKDDGSLVPLLSVLEVRPNAAFLFDPMQAAPPIRREVTHGPLKHEALSGLLVRFADPEAAEAALVSSGVVRDLVLADAQWIEERFYGPPPAPVTEQAAA